MPEFEESKLKPDLNKDTHQYQPSQEKSDQHSAQSTQNPAHSSNMRGRWKRPSRGPTKPIPPVKEDREDVIPSIINESSVDEEEFIYQAEEEEERTPTRQERTPRPQQQKQTSSNKPINRKDIFIPKTKQESERHKTRYPAMGQKQPSFWHKILAFFGLVSRPKKHPRKHREDHQSERPHSGSYQKKRYSQPRKHPAQRSHPSKNPGKQGPKSSF